MNEIALTGRAVSVSNCFITSFLTIYECLIVLGRLQFTTSRAVRRLRGNTGARYLKNLLGNSQAAASPSPSLRK